MLCRIPICGRRESKAANPKAKHESADGDTSAEERHSLDEKVMF